MKKERKKRYKEKLDYVRDRMPDLEEWLYEEAKESKTIFASEKAFQEVVEALADIFAMVLSDLNLIVKDDYFNIEKLEEKKILSKEDVNTAIEANGLRNRVVHRYNHIDEEKFIDSAKELLPKLDKVFIHIEDYIEKLTC